MPAHPAAAKPCSILPCLLATKHLHCVNLQIPFQLERVNRGQLLITVPSLMPRQHYQLKVRGSQAIRDAYGLPLEDSTAYFFTNEPAADLSLPELASSSSVSTAHRQLLCTVQCCGVERVAGS
jgi:hypothetical protein